MKTLSFFLALILVSCVVTASEDMKITFLDERLRQVSFKKIHYGVPVDFEETDTEWIITFKMKEAVKP